jgi:hypothetical protein
MLFSPPQTQAIEETLPSQPTYTLRPLNYSVSYRQNVCDRQESFHNGNVTLRFALEGLQLRPFFLMGLSRFSPADGNGSVPLQTREPAIRILDELAERARFTWRDSYGVGNLADALDDGTTGEESNKVNIAGGPQRNRFNANLDQILHWAVRTHDLFGNGAWWYKRKRNCRPKVFVVLNRLAFGLAEFSKTLSRVANGTSFLEGHIDASIIMVGKADEEVAGVDLFSFLAPFDWQVWLMTLLTMVIAGLVYQWMEWINEDSDRQDLQKKPSETMYFAALSFNGDIKFQPSTNYARLFVLTIAFWGLILSSAYTANLASFLVTQNAPVLQIETIGEAVAANLPLCVLEGSAQEFEVLNAYPLARLVPIPAENPDRIFTDVLKGRCKLAITPLVGWDIAKRNRTINEGCKLSWIGRTFRFAKSGFASRSDSGTLCTNLIRDVLSVHISEMIDDGTMDSIYRQYFRSIQTIDCNREQDVILDFTEFETLENEQQFPSSTTTASSNTADEEAVQSLSLKDLGGLFIVIYVVGFLACIAAIITWYRNRGKKRKKSARRIVEEHDLNLEVEIDEDRNGDVGYVTRDNGSGMSSAGTDSVEQEQLISKLDTMQKELEEMKSLIKPKGD